MPVQRTDDAKVTSVLVTEQPTYGRTVTGYGGKIPTRYMLKYDGRNRRVYAMSYGNSSSLYIIVKGQDLFLDQTTEYKLESLVTECEHQHAKATCGNCGKSWCDACDPSPSALCHYCHGRGYSIAPR